MINISCLGNYGHFGNQLFQYAFAHFFCKEKGYTLHTPSWVGQTIFQNVNNTPIESSLPLLPDEQIPTTDNVDIRGYFQNPEHLSAYSRAKTKSLFKFKPEIEEKLEEQRPKDFYIACHVRRGDYAQKYSHVFALIDERYYIEKVEELGYKQSDILWVREETSIPNKKLSPKLRFLQDFWNIMKAPVILRANSSFSWWAGTLADHDKVWSPLVEGKTGWHQHTPFICGNWPAIVHNNNLWLE